MADDDLYPIVTMSRNGQGVAMKLLSTERDARTLLEGRAVECNEIGTDLLRLTPPEFCGVIQADDGAFGWSQNAFTGIYQPFWRSPLGQRYRVVIGLDQPGAGRFTSMSAVAELLGGH
jgi:hypothetical protein